MSATVENDKRAWKEILILGFVATHISAILGLFFVWRVIHDPVNFLDTVLVFAAAGAEVTGAVVVRVAAKERDRRTSAGKASRIPARWATCTAMAGCLATNTAGVVVTTATPHERFTYTQIAMWVAAAALVLIAGTWILIKERHRP